MNGSSTGAQLLASLIAHELLSHLSYASNNPSCIDVFTATSTDAYSFKSACSSSGCLPLTIGLKAISEANLRWNVYTWKSSQDHWKATRCLWERLKGKLAGEMLRFLTFEALGVPHTCCTGIEVRPPDAPFLVYP